MKKSIEYPVKLDWRQHWTEWHAVREIVQNAMDETEPEKVEIKQDNDGLLVLDGGQGLEVKNMLFGDTNKGKEDRGTYGEGLKMAMIVLTRLGYDVEIESGKFHFINDTYEMEGQECFKIQYEEREVPIKGTRIRIWNYDGDTFGDRFIGINNSDKEVIYETERGDLLEKENQHGDGKLFVKDIYVQDLEDSAFSYNLKYLELTESREVADSFNLKREIQKVWKEIDDVDLWTEFMDKLDKGECFESQMRFWGDRFYKSPADTSGAIETAFKEIFGDNACLKTSNHWKREANWRNYDVISMRSISEFDTILPTDKSVVQEEQDEEDIKVKEDDLTDEEYQNLLFARSIHQKLAKADMNEPKPINVYIMDEDKLGKVPKEGNEIRLARKILKKRHKVAKTTLHESAHALRGTFDMTREHLEVVEQLAGNFMSEVIN